LSQKSISETASKVN